MERLLLLAFGSLLLGGCCSRPNKAPPPAAKTQATTRATTQTTPAPTVRTPAATSQPLSPREAKGLAFKALHEWENAQNTAQANAYLGLYDPATFQGVLRTSDGSEKKLNFSAWKEQRSRMIVAGVTVAAELPKAISWAESPGLGPGVVEMRFTQRWKNAKYGDHGQKIMRFRVSRTDTKIIYEEMVNSAPGWSENAPCGGENANSELPCSLPGNRFGWCKGGVCKDVCPAGFSYDPDDTQCHLQRDCANPDGTSRGLERTAQCGSCFGIFCMDPDATRSMKP